MHYNKIDGLRAVAISLVLLEHFAMIIGRPIFAGFYGVDLFFVLSGFLVTGILINPNDKTFLENYKRFIGRRTLRIFPIYYLTILIFFFLDLGIVRENLFYLLTYTFNYAIGSKNLPNSAINHVWSLCVEEQFYLLWPLIVLLFRNKVSYLIILVILIICIGYSQQMFGIFPSHNKYNYYSILTRMAPLGFGALGAILASRNMLPKKLFNSIIVEAFVFLLLIGTLIFTYEAKLLMLGLCSLFFTIKAALFSFKFKYVDVFLANRKIMYLGTISYGIYIYHLPIGYYFTNYVFDPIWDLVDFKSFGRLSILQWHSWVVKLPLYSFLSFHAARLSFNIIETPILKLKNKYFA